MFYPKNGLYFYIDVEMWNLLDPDVEKAKKMIF